MRQDLEDYIDSHITPDSGVLGKIDRETNLRLLNGRMCSGHIQGRMLKMLVEMAKPMRVLELGTFSGYSALCMAEGLAEGGRIDTIEIDDENEDFIRGNLALTELGKRVTLHIGDALEMAGRWKDGEFDMIFIDADKRHYPRYYAEYFPKLRSGGYIIADNTLWDGHVLEENPKSAQTRGIKEFNDTVASDPRVEVAVIPVRDGLTVIRKL